MALRPRRDRWKRACERKVALARAHAQKGSYPTARGVPMRYIPASFFGQVCFEMRLSDPVRSSGNNFAALRLLAALVVLASHHASFFGFDRPHVLGVALGDVAVMTFFVMSGYLVAESWVRDPHLVRFGIRRALRLWPGIVVATIAIVVLGAAVTTLDATDYFSRDVRRFISGNIQLKPIYVLPGVFSNTAVVSTSAAVNGSWWTLPIDVKCYGYFMVLAAFGLRRKWLTVLALVIAGVVAGKAGSTGDGVRQLEYIYIACFFGGLSVRQFREQLGRASSLIAAAIALGFSCQLLGLTLGIAWLATTILTIGIGTQSFPIMRSATKFGDLSFGLYLYGFAAQQTVFHVWPTSPPFVWTLLVAAAASLCCAWVSWHMVEFPALSLRRKLATYFPDHAV